ncbi:hypothetical protein HGB07_02050 [Candidatus Roizmanbacteria bacterium]|nr:hypothetical protein [Candidatus Roizmanbacteria bacterium]
MSINRLLTKLKRLVVRKNRHLSCVGVVAHRNKILLYCRSLRNKKKILEVAESNDGYNFSTSGDELALRFRNDKKVGNSDVVRLQFLNNSASQEAYIGLESGAWNVASSRDGFKWHLDPHSISLPGNGSIVSYDAQQYLYYGEANTIRLSVASDLKKWGKDTLVLTEKGKVNIEGAAIVKQGIVVFYDVQTDNGIVVHAVLFSKQEPTKCLWKTDYPVWEADPLWKKEARCIGLLLVKHKFISYWEVAGEGIFAVGYPLYTLRNKVDFEPSLQLEKSAKNPLISPSDTNSWEAFTTFNPAAVYLNDRVHIIYRAQGFDYISVLGYATSTDGIHVDERYAEPIYTPHQSFEQNGKISPAPVNQQYVSGGGYGGCEDPRITRIDDRLYMSYVAFDGWNPPRIALTSISIDDFLNRRWLWERPVIISPPGIVDKSCCILPEKVNGKYVIMHRIFPNIYIDYVDDLNFDGETWLKCEHQIKIRENMWDSRKIGAGAPPIKTKEGWLLIYYAVDDKDASKYKIGAMLLDLKDPTKVLHRSNSPVLEPDMHYENNGFKAGVAYPCGAVLIGENLFVYYGAADSYVCVATANLANFLKELTSSESAHLEPVHLDTARVHQITI